MDIQTRKINFIQEFLKIQNEEVVKRLEIILNKEKDSNSDIIFSPMSIEDFNKRIDLSLSDSANDKVTEIHDLLDEISKWR